VRSLASQTLHPVAFRAHALSDAMLSAPGFDKAVEECKYRMSRYGVSCALGIEHVHSTHTLS